MFPLSAVAPALFGHFVGLAILILPINICKAWFNRYIRTHVAINNYTCFFAWVT
jgi:hypothetical protein